jgi:hypothetical protein
VSFLDVEIGDPGALAGAYDFDMDFAWDFVK